jgi:hypothetical protein
LSSAQRWQVISYIRSKQSGGGAATGTSSGAAATTSAAKPDSTAKPK